MATMKKRKSKKELRKECEKLWSECVKKKAGYRSEYSGKSGRQIGGSEILNAHHICGKPNDALRFEIENGICLTQGEHLYIAHNTGRQEMFRKFILSQKGISFYDKMEVIKWQRKSPDLHLVKIYLENYLKEA